MGAYFGEKIMEYLDHGVPVMGSVWEPPAGCGGLVHATIYVVNTAEESERGRPAYGPVIRQLRGNGETLRSFPGAAWESRRISVFIANRNDRRDGELTKVIARMKRGLARGTNFDDERDW